MGLQRSSDFEMFLYNLRVRKASLKLEVLSMGKDPMMGLERSKMEGKLEMLNELIESLENRIKAKERNKRQLKQDKAGYYNARN